MNEKITNSNLTGQDFAGFNTRPDAKLWIFKTKTANIETDEDPWPTAYVFGYTWFEARSGALSALDATLDQVEGVSVEDASTIVIEAGSTVVFIERTGSFQIVETLRSMSGEEARTFNPKLLQDEESRTSAGSQSEIMEDLQERAESIEIVSPEQRAPAGLSRSTWEKEVIQANGVSSAAEQLVSVKRWSQSYDVWIAGYSTDEIYSNKKEAEEVAEKIRANIHDAYIPELTARYKQGCLDTKALQNEDRAVPLVSFWLNTQDDGRPDEIRLGPYVLATLSKSDGMVNPQGLVKRLQEQLTTLWPSARCTYCKRNAAGSFVCDDCFTFGKDAIAVDEVQKQADIVFAEKDAEIARLTKEVETLTPRLALCNRHLDDQPLCCDHAESWFTARNHLPTTDPLCVVCAFTTLRDTRITDLEAKVAKMTEERDSWRQDARKWLAVAGDRKPVVDAAVAVTDISRTKPYTHWIHPLFAAVHAYQGSSSPSVPSPEVPRVWVDEDDDEGPAVRWHVLVGDTVVAKYDNQGSAVYATESIRQSFALWPSAQGEAKTEGVYKILCEQEATRAVRAEARIADLEAKLVTSDAQLERIYELSTDLEQAQAMFQSTDRNARKWQVEKDAMHPVVQAAIAWSITRGNGEPRSWYEHSKAKTGLFEAINAYQKARSKPEAMEMTYKDWPAHPHGEPEATANQRYEVWQDDDSIAVFPATDRVKQVALMGPTAHQTRTIIAATWEAAMTTHHRLMGWTPYVPMDESESSTRLLKSGEATNSHLIDGEEWERVRHSMYEAGHLEGVREGLHIAAAECKAQADACNEKMNGDGTDYSFRGWHLQREAYRKMQEHLQTLAAAQRGRT